MSTASLKRINNHLIMYKINPRVFVASDGGGSLGVFLARGRTDLQIPWPEFECGGYSVTFWIKRVGLGYIVALSTCHTSYT